MADQTLRKAESRVPRAAIGQSGALRLRSGQAFSAASRGFLRARARFSGRHGAVGWSRLGNESAWTRAWRPALPGYIQYAAVL